MNIALLPNMLVRNERIIHSIKTALACLIGFLVAKYIYVRADQWIVITTLVVMCAQINVGSMIQKSYLRFLGTLAGSAIALLTLFLFGSNFQVSMIAVVLSAILFSYIATSDKSYSESGTLGAVTVTIILLGQNPTISTGIERCIEISLGILIAAVVSQVIFPIRAINHLHRNQASTIRKLRTFYDTIFLDRHVMDDMDTLRNLDEEIAKSLILQRKLASQAKQEHMGKRFNREQFQQSLWIEREILRCIVFMHHAYHATANTKDILANNPVVRQFHQAISESLNKIAYYIEKERIETILIPNISSLISAINEISTALDQNEKMHLDGFLFCAEILVVRLNKLVELI